MPEAICPVGFLLGDENSGGFFSGLLLSDGFNLGTGTKVSRATVLCIRPMWNDSIPCSLCM